MAKVTIPYLCIVEVEIDLERGTVDRVVVDDEGPMIPADERPVPPWFGRALDIARSQEWPQWEVGR